MPRPSPYHATASHCYHGDTIEALGDGLEPMNSGDHGIPRFTWWDHRGTGEWVQIDFGRPREVSSVEVYWFDDTGVGQCRIPKSWRLLYQDGVRWEPAPSAIGSQVSRDEWNRLRFPPVQTSALRIEVQLQAGFSGGILEWKVR